MESCRECKHDVSKHAVSCPGSGAPCPARSHWDGWGYEFKSRTQIFGMPFLHISFKFRPNRVPVPAKGFIAIGQFAAGIITVSQFGVGVLSLSQFTVAGYAVAQFAIAYSCIAQLGIYIDKGYGQLVRQLFELIP